MTNQTTANKSFILYQEYKKNISLLSQNQKGDLLDAIFAYNEGQEIQLDPIVKMAFSFIKADLDRNNNKYKSIVERNKINGSKGGRPSKPTGLNNKPKKPTGLFGNPNDNDNVNGNKDKEKKTNKDFETFWNLYNKKTSRVDAERKFKAALKTTSFENIINGLNKYIKSRGVESKFWKNPSTWLNQECWNDEYSVKNDTNDNLDKWSKY